MIHVLIALILSHIEFISPPWALTTAPYVRLLVPPTPAELARASWMLATEDEPVEYPELALRAASVRLGLLPTSSARFYFRGDWENRFDLSTMRRRYVLYADCPMLEDYERFPDARLMTQEYHRVARHQRWLEAQVLLFPDYQQRYGAEIARAEWYLKLYSMLTSRHDRENLKIIKDMLEPEEWALGLVPIFEE